MKVEVGAKESSKMKLVRSTWAIVMWKKMGDEKIGKPSKQGTISVGTCHTGSSLVQLHQYVFSCVFT